MQRRKFVQVAGKGLIVPSLVTLSAAHLSAQSTAQNKPVTARKIVDRIRKNLGAAWKDSGLDGFSAGDPGTHISGIATSFTASMDVLRRAVAAGKNMIIVREHPFYSHRRSSFSRSLPERKTIDPACIAKQKFIEENNLVVWRFTENWDARDVDWQLFALAKSLKWEGYHQPRGKSGEQPYHKGDAFFVLPETTLKNLALSINEKLNIKGMRIIGDPNILVRKVALSHGLIRVPELGRLLKEPAVDAVVIGEPVEWEASPYFEDVIASGQKKGMIIIGQAVSEDPGSGEVARWLETIVPEVSVECMPAGDPFWMLKPLKQL